MRIMSLDLSTKSTGWCLRDSDLDSMKWGTITASSTDVIKRIQKITSEVKKIIEENNDISTIILEEVRPEETENGVGNIHTHRVLMWLQASINFMLHDNFPNINVLYVYPSEWRKKCGIQTGRGIKRGALKDAVIKFAKDKYNIDVKTDDEADAIGIAHAFFYEKTYLPEDNEVNWG